MREESCALIDAEVARDDRHRQDHDDELGKQKGLDASLRGECRSHERLFA